MQTFQLQGTAFIELNKLMKLLDWVSSGGEAKIRIDAGEVLVNKEVETRRRRKLRSGDVVDFDGREVKIGE